MGKNHQNNLPTKSVSCLHTEKDAQKKCARHHGGTLFNRFLHRPTFPLPEKRTNYNVRNTLLLERAKTLIWFSRQEIPLIQNGTVETCSQNIVFVPLVEFVEFVEFVHLPHGETEDNSGFAGTDFSFDSPPFLSLRPRCFFEILSSICWGILLIIRKTVKRRDIFSRPT